jgi:hypothetical protein
MPEVLSVEKREDDRDAISAALSQALESALEEFDAMRAREGEKLRADIFARVDALEEMVAYVEKRPYPPRPWRTTAHGWSSGCRRCWNPSRWTRPGADRGGHFADKIAVDGRRCASGATLPRCAPCWRQALPWAGSWIS